MEIVIVLIGVVEYPKNVTEKILPILSNLGWSGDMPVWKLP